MNYHTLDQINEKLLFQIKKPAIDIHRIVFNFISHLDIGLEGIVTMCFHSAEPSYPMMIINNFVKSLMHQQYNPLMTLSMEGNGNGNELNLLSEATETVGFCELEKIVYQYMITTIPKHIIDVQMRQQKDMMAIQLLNQMCPMGHEN